MPLQLFLNDLSAPAAVMSRLQSIAFLKRLVLTVRAARAIDDRLILNCEYPLNELPLGTSTTIASIRNDGECVEESQYLKSLNNRAPLSRMLAEAKRSDAGGFEYKIPANAPIASGTPANALGLAHLFKGLAVSLPSHSLWQSREMALDLFELDRDGEVSEHEVTARNASEVDDVLAHETSLRQDLRPPFRDGKELWALKDEALPNLAFIPRVRAQIEAILVGDPLLEQAWIKLSGIDRAIATWRMSKTPHPMFPFNVRPESHKRMTLVKFRDKQGAERTFRAESTHVGSYPAAAK